jgi:hypothetical protein
MPFGHLGALFGSVRLTPFAWVAARCSRDLKRQRGYPELLMQTGRVAPRAAAQAQGRGFGWSVQRALFGSVRLIRFRLGRSGGLRDLERQCVPRALLMQGRPRAPPAREWAVAVAVLFGEYKAPLYVVAFRTYEGVVLEARDCHRVVLDHVQQNHFSSARHTTHHTPSSAV